jgi:c-di-GMP-binding flagellar brake protein YcgR
MSEEKRLPIVARQEIWIQDPCQKIFIPTIITEVEGDILWIGLPRDGGQIIMLHANQQIQISVSHEKSFYSAESRVIAIGGDFNKLYGLAKPSEFTPMRERRFVRADYPSKVLFKSGKLTVESVLVNFSAGGIMVYLTDELDKILQSKDKIMLCLKISKYDFELEVHPAWRRTVGNSVFAGLEFTDLIPALQGALAALAVKYK